MGSCSPACMLVMIALSSACEPTARYASSLIDAPDGGADDGADGISRGAFCARLANAICSARFCCPSVEGTYETRDECSTAIAEACEGAIANGGYDDRERYGYDPRRATELVTAVEVRAASCEAVPFPMHPASYTNVALSHVFSGRRGDGERCLGGNGGVIPYGDCKAGAFCEGVCVRPTCGQGTTCPQGEVCIANACERPHIAREIACVFVGEDGYRSCPTGNATETYCRIGTPLPSL